MESSLRRFNDQHRLVCKGDRILVGVSGGPDSMALLHWLITMRDEWELTLVVIHVNHSLRGKAADADQAYVEAVCRQWNVPCHSVVVDVPRYVKKNNVSKQTAARECRYRSYAELAQEEGLTKLALAHHADDQLETMLMRLVRGSGRGALSGIPVQREWKGLTIIRPLMGVTKRDIMQYCQQNDIIPRLDLTNLEDHDTRNYLRLHVVPLLERLNPNVQQTAVEMGELLEAEDRFLEAEAQRAFKRVVVRKAETCFEIDRSSFQRIPLPLQRRVILLILNCLLKVQEKNISWNKVHIDQILKLSSTGAGSKQVSLPHATYILREYDKLILFRGQKSAGLNMLHSAQGAERLPLQLPTTGEVEYVTENGLYVIRVQLNENGHDRAFILSDAMRKQSPEQRNEQHGVDEPFPVWRVRFDAEQLHFPLAVRCRQAGDHFQPLGMDGHKKLKNLFIDHKVPLRARNGWPLIIDQQGILWVPGIQRSGRGKLTAATKSIVTIEVRYLREGNHT